MMLKTYPAIFHEEDGLYWVEFPEFGGGTQGATLDEALTNAKEMLQGVLATYIAEKMALPEPSDITSLKVDKGFTTLVQADPAPLVKGNKTIRTNVSVPEWIVVRARKEKINFSKVLTDALLEQIEV